MGDVSLQLSDSINNLFQLRFLCLIIGDVIQTFDRSDKNAMGKKRHQIDVKVGQRNR